MCWWASDEEWCAVKGFFVFFYTVPDYILTAHYHVQGPSSFHTSRLFEVVVRFTCWMRLSLRPLKVVRSFCRNPFQNFCELGEFISELGVIINLTFPAGMLCFTVCYRVWKYSMTQYFHRQQDWWTTVYCSVFALQSNKWRHCHSWIWLLFVQAALIVITVEWR